MIALKRKPKPAAESASEFDTAKARWTEVTAKHRELLDRAETMKLALQLTNQPAVGRAPQHLRDRAKPFLKLAAKRRPNLFDQLAEVELAIEESNPAYHREREAWAATCRRETTRIARELQRPHKRAVKAMAKAVEALSLAIVDEIETRAELARTAPECESSHLPDCTYDLKIGTLADFNSAASTWARRMRKLEILG